MNINKYIYTITGKKSFGYKGRRVVELVVTVLVFALNEKYKNHENK